MSLSRCDQSALGGEACAKQIVHLRSVSHKTPHVDPPGDHCGQWSAEASDGDKEPPRAGGFPAPLAFEKTPSSMETG
jgi:hypothetical protein